MGNSESKSGKQGSPPPTPVQVPQAGAPVSDMCVAAGCKAKGKQFSFCATHYDEFKFGLIRKDGKRSPDYEKKFEHFVAYKERMAAARKVA